MIRKKSPTGNALTASSTAVITHDTILASSFTLFGFLFLFIFSPEKSYCLISYSAFGPAFTMASGMLVYFLKFLMKLWASSLAAAS